MNMKRILLHCFMAIAIYMTGAADARAIPFIRNFSAAQYGAHNRNYDIACDDNGTVYVANFEGLLYYDGATWRKIHTPGISRVTRVAIGKKGRVWVGGHNIFGYLKADSKGRLKLECISTEKDSMLTGEVDMIKVTKQRVYVHTAKGKAYYVKNDKLLAPLKTISPEQVMNSSSDSLMNLRINGMTISIPPTGGLAIKEGNRRYTITEEDGLCSNSINFITYNNRNSLWVATNHGIATIEMPSPFSHISEEQGLHGEVYSIGELDGTIYAGTLQGLYRIVDNKPVLVGGIDMACWQLLNRGNTLLAATTSGLWMISKDSKQRLTESSTLSIITDNNGGYFTGELDGVYYRTASGKHTKVADIEKVIHMKWAGSKLVMETIYGEMWTMDSKAPYKKECTRKSEDLLEPKLTFRDSRGREWETDPEGKDLSLLEDKDSDASMWIRPFADYALNAVLCSDENILWAGGEFGLINCDLSIPFPKKDEEARSRSKLFIREIVIAGDSVVWGGYSPEDLSPLSAISGIHIPSNDRSVTICYSAEWNSVFSPIKYRHRINGGPWSAWSTEASTRFNNMAHGKFTFEVQAIDLFGNITDTAEVDMYVEFPIFMRWWALLIYLLLILLGIRAFMNYRTKMLERDKKELEKVVSERTSELSNALDDLQRTQADLVRMERTATAGKLTQGLIDRILNPINYINNFSKLTSGLAKDLREDVEDEKDNMEEDNYEDCMDILDMMQQNLGKIEEHGVNTTRTLRAMEAMLKSHIGAKRMTDMSALCTQAVNVAQKYHKEAIEASGIKMLMELPETPLQHEVDPESINNVLLAILTNSVYAVTKKYQRLPYGAEIMVKLCSIGEKRISIHIIDNGIGIEETIMDKVFDPFFTTKTTSEAAGVGLYLAREIVQDHNGTITLKSEKDQYTEITINL